jgi:hypothetical protein
MCSSPICGWPDSACSMSPQSSVSPDPVIPRSYMSRVWGRAVPLASLDEVNTERSSPRIDPEWWADPRASGGRLRPAGHGLRRRRTGDPRRPLLRGCLGAGAPRRRTRRPRRVVPSRRRPHPDRPRRRPVVGLDGVDAARATWRSDRAPWPRVPGAGPHARVSQVRGEGCRGHRDRTHRLRRAPVVHRPRHGQALPGHRPAAHRRPGRGRERRQRGTRPRRRAALHPRPSLLADISDAALPYAGHADADADDLRAHIAALTAA